MESMRRALPGGARRARGAGRRGRGGQGKLADTGPQPQQSAHRELTAASACIHTRAVVAAAEADAG